MTMDSQIIYVIGIGLGLLCALPVVWVIAGSMEKKADARRKAKLEESFVRAVGSAEALQRLSDSDPVSDFVLKELEIRRIALVPGEILAVKLPDGSGKAHLLNVQVLLNQLFGYDRAFAYTGSLEFTAAKVPDPTLSVPAKID